VHLVDVDVVDAQRAQRVLDARLQRCAARVAHHAIVRSAQPALRGDDDLVAAASQLVSRARPSRRFDAQNP
jgi:hypothetical protein